MAEIRAFQGIRYDLKNIASLSDVVAPPYDVIDSKHQKELYERHPANVVRLILNRDEPGDDANDVRYKRAAQFLQNWISEGVLQQDPEPSIYVYHQQFQYLGQTFVRRGFMCRCRLERFGEGKIFPHEDTMAGPKQDRLMLTRACRANLSQIFGLYPDDDGAAQQLLEDAAAKSDPVEAVDDRKVVHRLWAITGGDVVNNLVELVRPVPIFIADGHHRYETACAYRDELTQQQSIPADHPANFVLMYLNGMSDPGLIVLPTHRLFHGIPELTSQELIARLGGSFVARVAGEGTDLAEIIWSEIERRDEQSVIGLFTAKDERWVLAELTDAGRERLRLAAPEASDDWRSLGVSILHRLIVSALLGIESPPKPKYVHLVSEAADDLDSGEFPLAALVMPAGVEHIRNLSEKGERMPAKSTYFYPKLLSGLVINPLS